MTTKLSRSALRQFITERQLIDERLPPPGAIAAELDVSLAEVRIGLRSLGLPAGQGRWPSARAMTPLVLRRAKVRILKGEALVQVAAALKVNPTALSRALKRAGTPVMDLRKTTPLKRSKVLP